MIQFSLKVRCYANLHRAAIILFGTERADYWLESCWTYEQINAEINHSVDSLIAAFEAQARAAEKSFKAFEDLARVHGLC